MTFEEIFQHVVMIEGGYVNDPKDSGGATRYGITEAVARANGYTGHMNELPLEKARDIYKSQYWDVVRGDQVVVLSPKIAQELFDTGVNMGVGVAGKYLQLSLNALNRGARDFQDVTVDGVIGPVTVNCLKEFLLKRGDNGEKVLYRALNALQCVRYIELSQQRPKDEEFVYGWILNRVQ